MPRKLIITCIECGIEVPGIELEIKDGIASKKTVEHTIKVNLEVERRGPVNSVSEPIGRMPNDVLCLDCFKNILNGKVHK